jgi:hypothetical protein
MKTVACPSCGAPTRFRGGASIVAVCAFCKSTLVRDGVKIENIGKQAELLEDDSPIRIGADGKHRGVRFEIVGRIQYRYGAGLWNEWYVLFPGGKSAWLSDASREYTIAYLIPPAPVPAYESLRPGQNLTLGGGWWAGVYTAMNMEAAEVIAGEGELPFKFQSGWKANVADLRGDGARFATIDYSETVPHIYVGEKLPFDTFSFGGLRDPEQVGFTKGTALAFKCAGCGAPIEKHITTTEVVACASCGSVTDVTKGMGEIVQKNELNLGQFNPPIPLGTVGKWKNVRYEVVGFMRRQILVSGLTYAWSEWLLHNVERGYAWISEYGGHYNLIHTCAEIPKQTSIYTTKPAVRYLGHTFTHFQRSQAQVAYVCGEFYWRVQLGDKAQCNDYIFPPLILSSESTGNELTWSIGEYVEPAELWKAFKLKTLRQEPVGVAPNQPSPHEGKVAPYWIAFFALLVLGFIVQLVISGMQASKRPVPARFTAATGETTRTVSPVFDLGGWGSGPATVRMNANVTDTWVAVNVQLTEADTGRAYGVKRTLGFTKVGSEVQGTNYEVAEIPSLPKGRYTLAVDATVPTVPPVSGVKKTYQGQVEVYRPSSGWSNYLLFTGFLFLWPLIAWMRKNAFETKRWSESDYAPEDSGGGGDDDD